MTARRTGKAKKKTAGPARNAGTPPGKRAPRSNAAGTAGEEPKMRSEGRTAADVREATERLAELSRKATRVATDTALNASRRAVGAAPAVVIKAASILEEEVASGLGAVKRIEQRFLDVDALRQQNPDAVMSRFRRDAHEAVDIILDVLTAAAQTVGQQAGRFVNVTAGAATSENGQGGGAAPTGMQLPALRVPGRVAAGASGTVAMSLENPSGTGTADFSLQASDLVSASGGRIPAAAVDFAPGHLNVGPGKAGRVDVTVAVPAGTPPGTYEGLVRATTLEGLRALLTVVVS